MKNIFTIIAAILFGILFYDKGIGLNLTIFSLITIAFLIFHNHKKLVNTDIKLYLSVYLITALFVFIQHTALSVIANILSFITLVGALSENKTAIYINWINGMFTTIAGSFYRNFEANENPKTLKRKSKVDVTHNIKLITIPMLFLILFVLLYKNGNPMFNDLISKINFDFVNFPWLLFCILGYFLYSNILKPIKVEPATSTDLQLKNTLLKSDLFSEKKLKKETQLGATLLGLLNVLIVFYIITDIAYLASNTTTHASIMSNQVHNSINTLIASIVTAILIIIYFFRGDLNFYDKNKTLKKLTYLWIGLNIVLIVLIALKNQQYITSFGLTYKRIGVHVYILLTLIGLITTLIKVMKIKNVVFLFRRNTQIAFAILLMLSAINWDKTITKYNLTQSKSFDIEYLVNLSERNAIILYEYMPHLDLSDLEKKEVDIKYKAYFNSIKQRSWQELHYQAFKLAK